MKRLRVFAPESRSLPSLWKAGALLLLAAQVTACEPEPAPTPEPLPNPLPVTATVTLTAVSPEAETGPDSPPDSRVYCEELNAQSALGVLDFRYDAYVVTAQASQLVKIRSDVHASANTSYPYGYGYPLSLTDIREDRTLAHVMNESYQNALDTGTAIAGYWVQQGQQYILVYKTFNRFTPLTYCLTLPAALTLEGRIDIPLEPILFPEQQEGPITLQNPRPDVLSTFVPWLDERVKNQ
ncbi:hypothetical protein SAMN05444354_105130 [Stigmatella aurantiaca]|uniref:Lipoprotein n=1 Tax=Stigmatella aurantiaca TaxID=41 RepID=A0A1H7P016_STIAU|nr:hypothetical protein [Stigmatella aurantiaca]SEL29151.1 hypothetical protein SAMN05444354_105130 [Stigmatella aurantiaca]